jgi:hypothetical protein
MDIDTKPPKAGGFSLWKIFRLIILGALVVVLGLMVQRPERIARTLPAAVAKQRSDEFQAKLDQLELAHGRGEIAEARFTADELNAAFQQSQIASAPVPAPVAANQSSQSSAPPDPATDITTTEIAFVDDHATGQFVVHAPGKDLYLTVSGKIGVVDGYATFEFTEAKVGDMPIPVSILNPKLQAKLQEPETRQRLKLPDYVSALRVENGQLVIVEK